MKTDTVILRISEQEKTQWQAAADTAGMTLSEYIRSIIRIELARKG